MPMHDWTEIYAGAFHDFHTAWIAFLRQSLNGGLLPPDHYALGEQVAGDIGPDVLTLRRHSNDEAGAAVAHDFEPGGGTAVMTVEQAPPKVEQTLELEDLGTYAARQRRVAIRHVSGDALVAIIEIVSRANRSSRALLETFVEKVITTIESGLHVLLIDPFPADMLAPEGVHPLIWQRLGGGPCPPPHGKPLMSVAYESRPSATSGQLINPRAYVQPLTVGDALTEMPLFLHPGYYVPVPLQTTYNQAFAGMPAHLKQALIG